MNKKGFTLVELLAVIIILSLLLLILFGINIIIDKTYSYQSLYDAIPEEHEEYFVEHSGYRSFPLDDELFPEVTFENSPHKIRLELVKEWYVWRLRTNRKPPRWGL